MPGFGPMNCGESTMREAGPDHRTEAESQRSPLVVAIAVLSAIAGSGFAMAGCGSTVGDYCDSKCKCENCGEQQRQECEIEADANVNVADAYGCTNLLDPYLECEVQGHTCSADGHYSDNNMGECKQSYEAWQKCLNSQTSRQEGPYQPPY